MKDESWQNSETFSRIENLAQNFESFDHSAHVKDEIVQNPEIFSRVENLA